MLTQYHHFHLNDPVFQFYQITAFFFFAHVAGAGMSGLILRKLGYDK